MQEIRPRVWGAAVVMHKWPWSTRKRALVTVAAALPILSAAAWALVWLVQELLALLPLILGGAAIVVMLLALLSHRDCEITVIHRRR